MLPYRHPPSPKHYSTTRYVNNNHISRRIRMWIHSGSRPRSREAPACLLSWGVEVRPHLLLVLCPCLPRSSDAAAHIFLTRLVATISATPYGYSDSLRVALYYITPGLHKPFIRKHHACPLYYYYLWVLVLVISRSQRPTLG